MASNNPNRSKSGIRFSKEVTEINPKHISDNEQNLKAMSVCVENISRETDVNSMESSMHCGWNRERPRKWDPWENGNFSKPHGNEPNEVNFLGGLGPNVGHARSKFLIKRPTQVQKIYNMRTRNQPVFTFCEDPRQANNVVAKKKKVDHTHVKLIVSKVDQIRLAHNIETPPPSDYSEDPTEVHLFIIISH